MLARAAALVIVLIATDVSLAEDRPSPKTPAKAAEERETPNVASPVAGGETGLVGLVKKILPSVVRIETDAGKLGSGVIVDDRGLVLTNYHVWSGARKALATLNSGVTLEIIGEVAVAKNRDLAILKTKPFEKHLAITVATEMPQLGEQVAAFGNPQGLTFTTSAGIVSAIRTGEEAKQMLGDNLYRKLGYTLTARWIQHTAAMSQGSSGGPLVNMRGELVGLNTWILTSGQNLNFAIGAPDINRLLGKSERQSPADLADAPKPTDTPESPATDEKPANQAKLKLVNDPFPSGRIYSPVIFEIPSKIRWDGNPVVMTYQNGSLFAVASHIGGKLHGLTVGQHENKQPMVYATYLDGKKHGLLETWNEKGDPVLFTQYTRNKPDGFSCFFEDGKLSMITEYRTGTVRCIRLISGVQVVSEFLTKAEAREDSMGRERLASLDETEKSLHASEEKFKNQVIKVVSPAKKAARRANDAQVAAAQDRAASLHQAQFERMLNDTTRVWRGTYAVPLIVK